MMLNILYTFLFTIVVTIILYSLSYGLSFLQGFQIPNYEKISPYECGFAPFSNARNEFEVKYYLVAILFLIFDLEMSYLFPWSSNINQLGLFSLLYFFIFYFILVIGFLYEWFLGALDH